MRFNMTHTSEGRSTIVIIDEDGNPRTITDSHPNYVRIAEALLHGGDDPAIMVWLDASAAGAFVDGRVTISDGVLHFDGDPVYNGLSDVIMRYRREGRDTANLIRFMERLSANPSRRSREQLFQWTQAKDMTIDADGYIIGYKGVSADLLSMTAGTAAVDGVEVTGNIPNEIGTVISMPRSEVQDDHTVGCSTGLHVGSWGYASSFGPVTLEVRIDPADVVSVPSDCSFQKMRCCRYEVIAVHESDEDDLYDYEPDATYDEDEAWDSFENYVPPTFLARLRDRLRRKGA